MNSEAVPVFTHEFWSDLFLGVALIVSFISLVVAIRGRP
jgi:hypothetical protein